MSISIGELTDARELADCRGRELIESPTPILSEEIGR